MQGDVLILPGGERWDQPELRPILEFARDALDAGHYVAAICGATNGLASVGALEIDPAAHRVTVGNVEVVLSALEFKLLATLYQRRDRVQTREVLLDEVWGGADGVGVRTVDACVKRLRQKLGSAGTLVETVRGVGYRFVASEGLSSRAG